MKSDYYQQVTKGHPRRWFDEDRAIRVYIAQGDGVTDYKPVFQEILRSAFKKWEEISESKIKLFLEIVTVIGNFERTPAHVLNLDKEQLRSETLKFMNASIDKQDALTHRGVRFVER